MIMGEDYSGRPGNYSESRQLPRCSGEHDELRELRLANTNISGRDACRNCRTPNIHSYILLSIIDLVYPSVPRGAVF